MRILLAVDGSGPSGVAVRLVREMPLPAGSVVRVLSVAQPPALTGEFGAMDYHRLAGELHDLAESVVRDGCSALADLECVESSVRTGDPRVEILAEARDWEAELIVMGSHGRTGLRRWFLGSVAEYVMRHAPCPVEIVRQQPTAEPAHP
jgi:nucleotide-binding universal stress UspA family protein